ncbi:MAG TPA: DJ-1/PfpI family protein [bacterium]|nr:DJ-1/PfpI family protein [bacterium]
MRTAFVLFDGLTALDFVGVYDPLTRLKSMDFMASLQWDLCAMTEKVTDSNGLTLLPTVVGKPLAGYDLLVVPGGPTAKERSQDPAFVAWIKTAAPVPLKVSVCSGALLLGAAGFLQGKKATTHAARREDLKQYCAEVVEKRVVDEGEVITCGGVTAGIDLGLYLCGKFVSLDAKEIIRHRMDYHSPW